MIPSTKLNATYIFKEHFADPVVRHRYPERVQEGLLKPPDFLQIREHDVHALRREDVFPLAQGFDVTVKNGITVKICLFVEKTANSISIDKLQF